MTKYEVLVSEQAQNDLKEIATYLSSNLLEPNIAKDILSEIDKSILSLEEMPYRYCLLSDNLLKKVGVRKLVVKNYIVFFKVYETKKTVGIVRIRYGRRNWQKMI